LRHSIAPYTTLFPSEARQRRAPLDQLDYALLVLTVFAAITQRTAFGRAEFRHQYFAAFLIGPILILLALIAFRASKMRIGPIRKDRKSTRLNSSHSQ